MKKIPNIPVKKTLEKGNLFLRGVSKEYKLKFQKRAKTLGYKQKEYFELIVKGL